MNRVHGIWMTFFVASSSPATVVVAMAMVLLFYLFKFIEWKFCAEHKMRKDRERGGTRM